MQKPVLLHTCCGPCSTASIERLLRDNWLPVLFFGNSNIFPRQEADTRFTQLLKVADYYGLEVIRNPWNHSAWKDAISPYEKEPEGGKRCELCFRYNLNEAFHEAKSRQIAHFTTTLTVSRYKNSSLIFSVGETFEGFTPIDFKKEHGYQRSIELSKQLNLYRQNYCGCEFSLNLHS